LEKKKEIEKTRRKKKKKKLQVQKIKSQASIAEFGLRGFLIKFKVGGEERRLDWYLRAWQAKSVLLLSHSKRQEGEMKFWKKYQSPKNKLTMVNSCKNRILLCPGLAVDWAMRVCMMGIEVLVQARPWANKEMRGG
jgi:hypothetical protein